MEDKGVTERDFGGIKRGELAQLLDSSDALGQILKGHLAVESVLGDALGTKAAQPKAFERLRLSFVRKVQLSVALGLLGESDEASFMVLNGIRNSLAHDYHYNISQSDAERLIESLPEAWQKVPPVVECVEKGTIKDLLFIGILVVYTIACKAVEAAIAEKEAFEDLRQALAEIKSSRK
jgi:hypothetical protein